MRALVRLFRVWWRRLPRPGVRYGYCYRCGRTWGIAKYHATQYDKRRGCLPLCEACWSALAPIARLRYYRRLWNEWGYRGREVGDDGERWEDIQRAVMEGL